MVIVAQWKKGLTWCLDPDPRQHSRYVSFTSIRYWYRPVIRDKFCERGKQARASETMRFLRFKLADGPAQYGIQHADGSVTVAEGDPFEGGLHETGVAAPVARTPLPPVAPTQIYCM